MALIRVEKLAILFNLIASMFHGLDGKRFRCDGYEIDESLFCDGSLNCIHGSDESSYGCDYSRCGSGKFACNESQCVPLSARCDAKWDCSDGSDEFNCEKGYFQCTNGNVIGGDWFCDGESDCADGSDEPSNSCIPFHCGQATFTCQDSGQECIPISLRCNGNKDCPDGSDEMNCENGYFQCTDGRLIGSVQFCDGKPNCTDGSDESYGCSIYHCGIAQFTCNDQKCLPISARCDAKSDCADGSDEINCEHAYNLKNCPLQEGKYLCKDRSNCISLARVCDGNIINDCIDGSDETMQCYDPTDTCDISCPHPCWRTPDADGPVCFCNYTDNSNQSLCNKVDDCDSAEDILVNMCTQKCVKLDGVIQCSCNEGYKLSHWDMITCSLEVPQEKVLLYSDEQSIVGYDMDTNSGRKFFIQNENNVTSISAAHSYIYWSSFSNNRSKIFRTKLLYQRREETIYSNPSSTSAITCIAVDWITNNTFFTSQTTLSVCNENGSACAQLKHSIYGFECVALLPRKGLMFWIENTENKYSKTRILKSSMDGSDEQVLVDENLPFTDHLVTDESSERIYWIDRESARIESIKYNGKQRKFAISWTPSTNFFTVFEGHVYNALKSDGGIFDTTAGEIWFKEISNIKKFHIFNRHLQKTKISNPCALSPCPGICLLRPASSSLGLNFTCLYEHLEIATQDNDKSSTFGNDVKILFVMLIVILILSLCVYMIFFRYRISLKTKRASLIMNDDSTDFDFRFKNIGTH